MGFEERSRALEVRTSLDHGGIRGLQRGDRGMQLGDLIFEVLNRVRQIESLAVRQSREARILGLRSQQVGLRDSYLSLRDIDLYLVRLLIELHQQIAFVHPIVIIDEYAHDVAGRLAVPHR